MQELDATIGKRELNPPVDLRPDQLGIVQRILRRHVPDRCVLAFGSRATWTAKKYSDLDLAILGDESLSLKIVAALKDELSESDLPFKVDVIAWSAIGDRMRKIVQRDGIEIQSEPIRLRKSLNVPN